MKRIAIFLGGYLPAKKYGGPVTSIANLVENLGNEFSFYIISNDHDLDETKRLDGIKDGWNCVGKAQVLYIPEKEYGYKRFSSILMEINADAVYLSSIFYYSMNLSAIRAARKLRIPVILATRGELSGKALRMKAWKKTPYLHLLRMSGLLCDTVFQATSDEEFRNICERLNISSEKVHLLPNFPSASSYKQQIVKESGKLRALIVCRLVPNKNILYAINLIKQSKKEVTFDIYGPIENVEYWEQCKAAMAEAPPNVTITYKGALEPKNAQSIYLSYDCLLFPTEFENYGQVIAEALSHDCPVIISKGTTPWDDLAESGAGYIAKIGEDEAFVKAIDTIANLDSEGYSSLVSRVRTYAQIKTDINTLRQGYLEMLSHAEKR